MVQAKKKLLKMRKEDDSALRTLMQIPGNFDFVKIVKC